MVSIFKIQITFPEEEDDDFKALEVAEKLKLQLKKIRINKNFIRSNVTKKKIRCSYFYKRNERWN